jgi:uncharacterized protein (DUF342 family)
LRLTLKSGRIKAYGNILVSGYTVANDKMKGCGKLKVLGTLEATELEIYGNVSITGYLYVNLHLRLVMEC